MDFEWGMWGEVLFLYRMNLEIHTVNCRHLMIILILASCCLAKIGPINGNSDMLKMPNHDLSEHNETAMPKVEITIVDPDQEHAQYSTTIKNTTRDLQTISLNTTTVIAGTAFKISVSDTTGYRYYAEIKNKCSFAGNYECVATSGREQVVDSDVSAEMSYASGVYSYTYTVTRPGDITINVIRYQSGGILYEYFPNRFGTGTRELTSYENDINVNYGTGIIYGTREDYASIKMHFRFQAPVTGTYTFWIDVDDDLLFYLDGNLIISRACCGTATATASLTAGQFYYGYAFFMENTSPAYMQIKWSYPGQSLQVIPTSNFYYPQYINSPKQVTVACAAGYSKTTVSSRPTCVTVCGDGKRAGTEECDDSNKRSGDGCSGSCTVESSWYCTGGTTSSADSCTFCYPGYYPSPTSNPTTCASQCGDKMQVGSEKCDDGNASNSDGCKSDCSGVEAGWVCSNSTFESGDVCTQCGNGYVQNDSTYPTQCVTSCGDSKRAGSEVCDNGSTAGTGGCSSDCTSITSGWVCSGGTPTSVDTCTQCSAGTYPNTAKTACVTICGDGLKAGTEKCDDGNTNNGDGCSSTCQVESSWVCTGGSTTAKDECTFCTTGWYQNNAATPTTCVTQCGDGIQVGTEKCDDGNTNDSDGCKGDCSTVETSWVCLYNSGLSKDVCTECTSGWHQNDATNPEYCVTRCGDGLEAGTEKCDDNNTNDSDGCKSDCSSVEAGWVCIGGSTTTKDVCQQCQPGFYQNNAANPETCVTICGDGFEAGTEKCDDGNTQSGDGCASDCSQVETNWACRYGSPTSRDYCFNCPAGYYQDSTSNPEYCVTSCGDGLRAGNEKCDDGNTQNGDGCSSSCTIEHGYKCYNGTQNSKDICHDCPLSYIPNENSRDCTPRKLSDNLNYFGFAYLLVMSIGIIANLLSFWQCKTPSYNTLGVVYYTQILMLLPLMNIDVGEDVIDFFRYTKDLLFSFNFIPNNLVFISHDDIFDKFHYKQENWYLYLLGFKSGSSISNATDFIFVMFLILMIAIIVIFLYLCGKDQEPDSDRFQFFRECKNLFLCGIWLQIICTSYIFLLMISVEEVQTISSLNDNRTSFIFASCSILACVLLLIFSIYKWWECRLLESLNDLWYTKILFIGTKDYAPARFFIIVWLSRRLLFTSLALSTYEFDKNILFGILIIIQLAYLSYVAGVRPFKVFSDNFGEIFNEVFILICFIFCALINKEEQWDRDYNRILLIVILIPNILFTSASIICLKIRSNNRTKVIILNNKSLKRTTTILKVTSTSYDTNTTMNKSFGRLNSSKFMNQIRNNSKKFPLTPRSIPEEQKEPPVNNIFGKMATIREHQEAPEENIAQSASNPHPNPPPLPSLITSALHTRNQNKPMARNYEAMGADQDKIEVQEKSMKELFKIKFGHFY
ncbi:unnamed protein product [Moneuplotes crassus]|uniref:PA14 domain-containing protein n=1 Tax=Euplotes crassus TaxID=5936 RepID=A0AAD1XY10_EUPCR|nr:unnamed protein product [Moneuplotes crassus]